jgi:DNA polymerase-3 subunit epsilon
MTWAAGPMACFDTETTSADPEEARIVTACIAWIDGANEVVSREWLVNPGVPIAPEASAIHGVTDEIAQRDGIQPATAAAQIFSHLDDVWSRGMPVVIMNAAFDLTILDRELRRHCDTFLGKPGPVIDPQVLDKWADRLVGFHRRGSRTLTALCEHYKVKLEGAHTAAGDCLAAARVAWRIAQMWPAEIGALTMPELQTLQVKAKKEQAESLRAYFASKGDPAADDVSGAWPMKAVA